MRDTNDIAESYLRDVERGNAHFYASAQEDIVVPFNESLTQRVVIMRQDAPPLFGGHQAFRTPHLHARPAACGLLQLRLVKTGGGPCSFQENRFFRRDHARMLVQ